MLVMIVIFAFGPILVCFVVGVRLIGQIQYGSAGTYLRAQQIDIVCNQEFASTHSSGSPLGIECSGAKVRSSQRGCALSGAEAFVFSKSDLADICIRSAVQSWYEKRGKLGFISSLNDCSPRI